LFEFVGIVVNEMREAILLKKEELNPRSNSSREVSGLSY